MVLTGTNEEIPRTESRSNVVTINSLSDGLTTKLEFSTHAFASRLSSDSTRALG